ncbi:MAG: AarF/UbiB family protein, partial [Actinomycetota bacterium]
MGRAERRQNLNRLREIAQVAARHGFGYLFGRDEAPDAAAAPGDGDARTRRSRGRRLREMLDELGPTFVKFGQLLSTRPDLLPPDVVAELRTLQDRARPVPFEEVRQVIEEDLGLTVEQVFTHFDRTPLAAASIGQVHRARLPGGQDVIVKVQRPDAERRVQADIQLLYQAARVARDRVKRLSFIDVVAVVDEFARTIRQELDYRIEARNTQAARRAFEGDATVVVPRVHWRQTAERVLTLDYIDGEVLSRVDLAAWTLEDRRTLAARVAETWMKMIFLHGFFHGDPHPANVVVIGPDRLGLIDFGMVGHLSERDRESAVRLLVDIIDRDETRIARRLRELGVRYPREREQEFREQLGVLVQRYYGVGLAEIDARQMLHDIMAIIYGLGVELPSRWALLDKALATLAGVGLEIYPDYNVFETARPYARRIMAARFRPDRVASRVQADTARYAEAILQYPFQIAEVLEEARDGELRITISPEGLGDGVDKATATGNRVALAILAAALFTGSSIMGAFVSSGPHLLGVAVIALPGLLLATLL